MDTELKQRIERAAAVLKAAGVREVYVFGSAVTGDRRPDSDVDLAVAGLPPERFFDAMGEAADALGCEVDLIDLDEPTPFTEFLIQETELVLVA